MEGIFEVKLSRQEIQNLIQIIDNCPLQGTKAQLESVIKEMNSLKAKLMEAMNDNKNKQDSKDDTAKSTDS